MYYELRNDVTICKNLHEYNLSFINDNKKCFIQINKSGYDILSLCTGQYTEKEIINILQNKYKDNNISEMVLDFIRLFKDNNLLFSNNTQKKENSLRILGSSEYYCPTFITLELTNNCPLNCKHCYLGKKKNIYINKNNLTNILKQIVDLGISFVQLTGGEVTTYPYLEYAIDYLTKHYIQVNVSTSGYDCNDNIIEVIKKIGKTGGFVRVSLDGLENYHNNIRQNKNSFKNAISFITKIISYGIPVQVATCVIDQNKEELSKLTNIVKSLGVNRQIFELVYTQGNAKENEMISKYTNNEFLEILKELSKDYSDDTFDISTETNDQNINCGAGYKIYKISYNLKVTPCVTMEYSLGDLNYETLEDIIKRNYKSFMHLNAPCKKICGNCQLLDKCEKCISKAMQYKNNIKQCNWYNTQNAIK